MCDYSWPKEEATLEAETFLENLVEGNGISEDTVTRIYNHWVKVFSTEENPQKDITEFVETWNSLVPTQYSMGEK